MFYSNIHSINEHVIYPKAIQEVINFLKEQDFLSMKAGVYEIESQMKILQVIELETKPYEIGKFESHEKFIDIQFLVKGSERIGFAPRFENQKPTEEILERDLYFYEENIKNETMLMMNEGDFAVFFPGDLHKPGLQVNGMQKIKKIVMKVNLELLKQTV